MSKKKDKEDKKYECIICKGPAYKEGGIHYLGCKKCRDEADEIAKTMTVDEAWRLFGEYLQEEKKAAKSHSEDLHQD